MSPWLFNVYMEGVIREVNVSVLGKMLELLSANGRAGLRQTMAWILYFGPVAWGLEYSQRLPLGVS